MDLIGKTTIHPILFYTGKFSGYITWIVLILSVSNVLNFEREQNASQLFFTYTLSISAIVLITISLANLGKSTRLGLPTDDTKLKTTGLYKFSRNPMYVGFNLLTISAMIYTPELFIIVPGIYSIFVYHLIIKAEEKFLEKRFGDDFRKFKIKTRRYL